MTTPSNPLPLDDPHEEIPGSLQGIAERLQAAINDVLVAKVDDPATSASISEVVDAAAAVIDRRLYFPDSDGWVLRVKSGAREYCSHRNPNEEWFHLLIDGELLLQFGEERVCLNCAFRSGLLTDDRLFWQKGHRRQRVFPVSDTDPKFDAPLEASNDSDNQRQTTQYDLETPTEEPR